jgi:endoglucanase
MDLKSHLKTLSEAIGPAGHEDPVRHTISAAWQPYVHVLDTGKLGSLIGVRHGSGTEPRRRVMLVAHMDENGLIVRSIQDSLIGIGRLGGPDYHTLPGTVVTVHGKQALPGVIGLRPPVNQSNNQPAGYPTKYDLIVDLGLSPEQVTALVQVGDLITLDAPFFELQNGRVAGKALDNRASVAAVTLALDMLQGRLHTWDVLAVASVQEEEGGTGAQTEAFRWSPDLAIAIDVTFATQPGVSEGSFKLGSGVTLGLGPVCHMGLYDAIMTTAERIGMTVQPELLPAQTGTDGDSIAFVRDGIPTAVIGFPLRNMHTQVETAELKDIERCGRLLAEFVSGLTPDFMATLNPDGESEASA